MSMTDECYQDIERIRQILKNAEHAVFFGGAGVSTDSGIPDFRGKGGLYTHNSPDGFSQEYLLSRECLSDMPERFFEFYKTCMNHPNAEPNATHKALAELEHASIIKAVITQNIDGLHQKAGSKNVIELHGTTRRAYCSRCGKLHSPECIYNSSVPRCEVCSGIVRPDVTLYGESLGQEAFFNAEREIDEADVLIVGGSSLSVYPAASFVRDFGGEHLIIINYSPTQYDADAEIVIHESLSEVFELICAGLV